MKRKIVLMFIIMLLFLYGCKTNDSDISPTNPPIDDETEYTYEVPKYKGYGKLEAPDSTNYEEALKFGYWWEEEMINNPNWWDEDYIIDESNWHDEDFYAPINTYIPNSNFEYGDQFVENQFDYYRFHSFVFSVMPYRHRYTNEVLHCANFNFTYTWFMGDPSKSDATFGGPTIILPETIEKKLESGYFIKDPTYQFMYNPNNEAQYEISRLKNNYKILTPYMSGVVATEGGYGNLLDPIRTMYEYKFFLPYRPEVYNFMKTQNKNFNSGYGVSIRTEWFGFCKTTVFTEDDINTIAESDFLVVFPEGRYTEIGSEPITGKYITPPYIEAKIGSPVKVIPPVISPFEFTTNKDVKNFPLMTLVDQPFIHYMR